MTLPNYGSYDNLTARYAKIAASLPNLVPAHLAKNVEANLEGVSKGLRFKFEGHGEIDIYVTEDFTDRETLTDDAGNEFVRFTLKFSVEGPRVSFDLEGLDAFLANLAEVRDVLDKLEDQFLGPIYEFMSSEGSREEAQLKRTEIDFANALKVDERVMKMRIDQVIELNTKLHDTAFEMHGGRNNAKKFMVVTTKGRAQITRVE